MSSFIQLRRQVKTNMEQKGKLRPALLTAVTVGAADLEKMLKISLSKGDIEVTWKMLQLK